MTFSIVLFTFTDFTQVSSPPIVLPDFLTLLVSPPSFNRDYTIYPQFSSVQSLSRV